MRKNILICDDDPDILEIASLLLVQEGHKINIVQSSEGIWDEIASNRPDLILMDLWMPKMGGEEATKRLKSEEDTKDIRVIIVSASPDIAEIASRSGADGYLSKPFNINDLKMLAK